MPINEHLGAASEVKRLELLATRIRRDSMEWVTKSKVGHVGGALSVTDILTAIYFGRTYDEKKQVWEPVLVNDPLQPLWPERDRVILSKGHASPAWYTALAHAGYFSKEVLKIYRKIDSPLEGHPIMYQAMARDGGMEEHGIRGVDFNSGSLGHGMSVAAGMALNAKAYGHEYLVYALMGDGDLQEGMTWEALMCIPNKGLNRVMAFIDYNHLQVDGRSDDLQCLDPLADKLKAFNWEVREIGGHDFSQILDCLHYFKTSRKDCRKPLMVVANTVKGKGVEICEDVCAFHAVPLSPEQFGAAARDLDRRMDALESELKSLGRPAETAPRRTRKTVSLKPQSLDEIIANNPAPDYDKPTATRLGYGSGLARLGEYRPVFVLNADLASPCGTDAYIAKYPEHAADPLFRRSMNLGVQEANMVTMGAAMASCGKMPFVHSFGIFITGRAWEMVRQDICYPNLNVKIVGSHTGIALGEYGVSHQSIEDVGVMRTLPNMSIVEPSDARQADLLMNSIMRHEGPLYLRLGRNPTEVFYRADNPYKVPLFEEFELGKGYKVRQGSDLTLICSGPILAEALKAADMVTESVAVIDMPSIRPLDDELVASEARSTGWVATVQDHYIRGGLSDEVLSSLAASRISCRFDAIAVEGYAKSGSAADLYERYGLSARRIVERLGLSLKQE